MPPHTFRCAHPHDLAVTAGESAWAVTRLRYFAAVAYPGVDPAAVRAELAEAVRGMTAVCGMSVDLVDTPADANIDAAMGPIDGPWNVLALSELPPPRAPGTLRLRQTFDAAESGLTSNQRIAMFAHELGHCLGLGHAPAGSGNLMEPVLGAFASPQPGDVAELQARYGPPGPAPAPPDPGPADAPLALVPAEDLTLTLPGGSLTLKLSIAVLSALFTPAS